MHVESNLIRVLGLVLQTCTGQHGPKQLLSGPLLLGCVRLAVKEIFRGYTRLVTHGGGVGLTKIYIGAISPSMLMIILLAFIVLREADLAGLHY